MIKRPLSKYRYLWPSFWLSEDRRWEEAVAGRFYQRHMPETAQELSLDSSWPAFFPSAICLVTTADKTSVALEKVVGPLIVNRSPFIMALSFCREDLSKRHCARRQFMRMLEAGGGVAVQFLSPGEVLDHVMNVIASTGEEETSLRLSRSCLAWRKAISNDAPVLQDAYLVYEGRLAGPRKDSDGQEIYGKPWVDVGSHRLYFFEVGVVQLHQDIAEGRSQLAWRSLPAWDGHPDISLSGLVEKKGFTPRYQKKYTPYYRFPSAGTAAFIADGVEDGMSVKVMPSLSKGQVRVDNDAARWPCFFPSSLGMITSRTDDGRPNLMPCGSTAIVGRHPLTLACSVCYADINERYARRASLGIIRHSGVFGCGVPFIDDSIVKAIAYAGSVSIDDDPDKVAHTGLEVEREGSSPVVSVLPVHFDCRAVEEVRLGTHAIFLGRVTRIFVRSDVSPHRALEWYPWADVVAPLH